MRPDERVADAVWRCGEREVVRGCVDLLGARGAPEGGAGLLLARAANDAQRARVGDQTGGRVAFFLHTDDFTAAAARLQAAGVPFVEGPRQEDYGTVGVFADLYGNRWDLIEGHG